MNEKDTEAPEEAQPDPEMTYWLLVESYQSAGLVAVPGALGYSNRVVGIFRAAHAPGTPAEMQFKGNNPRGQAMFMLGTMMAEPIWGPEEPTK